MSKNTVKETSFDYAIPPGATLLETIEKLGMSQKEFALRSGLTVQTINRIYKGAQPITYETADRLEMVTGVSARFWNNLEALYREQLAKIERTTNLDTDVEWLSTIPVKELVERGYIHPSDEKIELLRNTLSFYGVSSVESWKELWVNPRVAARRSSCFESQPGHASAWIRMGELKAMQVECKPYNRGVFKNVLNEIRSLTIETPNIFEPRMKELCANAGVAVSLVREMKKVPWSGATKWLTPKKAMILLSLRGRKEDVFWFSFFHEAGHVLNDNKKELYINDEKDGDLKEERANHFASEFLIQSKFNKVIIQIKSKNEVKRVANDLGVSPGIVAGRYRHLTKRWNYFNDIIRGLEWNETQSK